MPLEKPKRDSSEAFLFFSFLSFSFFYLFSILSFSSLPPIIWRGAGISWWSWFRARGGGMRSEPYEKKRGKMQKMWKMRGKMREKCGKMRSKPLGLRKITSLSWQWSGNGRKITSPKPRQNTADKIRHQLWPISMKIGPNDILREHFGYFLPFMWPNDPEKVPQIPRN